MAATPMKDGFSQSTYFSYSAMGTIERACGSMPCLEVLMQWHGKRAETVSCNMAREKRHSPNTAFKPNPSIFAEIDQGEAYQETNLTKLGLRLMPA